MNITPDPEMPERKGPQKPKSGRSFEDLLKDLQPQLNKLPPEQKLPPLPPDKMILESVQDFVTENGMIVPESCPTTIAIAGEFLDRCQLREGRVGLFRNVRVVSFLHRYSDKTLRAVVVFPRKGVDARKLGLSIFWGLTADVPESVALSEICSLDTFFQINSFNLAGVVDLSALDLYKMEYHQSVDAELVALNRRALRAESMVPGLESRLKNCEEEMAAHRSESLRHQERADWWRFYVFFAVCLIPTAHLLLRYFGF